MWKSLLDVLAQETEDIVIEAEADLTEEIIFQEMRDASIAVSQVTLRETVLIWEVVTEEEDLVQDQILQEAEGTGIWEETRGDILLLQEAGTETTKEDLPTETADLQCLRDELIKDEFEEIQSKRRLNSWNKTTSHPLPFNIFSK